MIPRFRTGLIVLTVCLAASTACAWTWHTYDTNSGTMETLVTFYEKANSNTLGASNLQFNLNIVSNATGGSVLGTGFVAMYSGSLVNFDGTGLGTNTWLVGWALCNGTNGTPNLSQRFVKGWRTGINPGATGGNSTYTPAGTLNTGTFTGAPVTLTHSGTAVDAHNYTPAGTNNTGTFTGAPFTSIINHTHPLTDPGHSHVEQMNTATTGGAGAGFPAVADASTSGGPTALWVRTSTNTVGITETDNPAGGVSSITPAGTNSAAVFFGLNTNLTHAVTQPDNHSFTPLGTNSAATFTGTQVTVEPDYLELAYIMRL